MKRRSFLRTLGGAAASAGLGIHLQCRPSPGASTSHQETRLSGNNDERWTWVHGASETEPAQWRERFAGLAREGFTGVLVGGGPTDILSEAAHANGLEFHRWIWTLNRNGDAWVRENHPEWFTVSRNLESSLETPPYVDYYRWLCPTRPEVRQYLRDSILKIARDPSVDGIHLDYIRHCDVILPRGLWSKYDLIQDREYPEFDFCYCDACRSEYSALHGVDPLDLPDPAADETWRRFRWDSVTDLVRILADAVHGIPTPQPPEAMSTLEAGREEGADPAWSSRLRPGLPGKAISAAVFPTPAIARRLVRQAWDEWPMDAFFPMLYHEFYQEELAWIGRGVEEGLRALAREGAEADTAPGDHAGSAGREGRSQENSSTTRPNLLAGLYLPTLNRDGNRQEAVEIATGAGADGVCFFEMTGLGL